jgi:hypothetical protein
MNSGKLRKDEMDQILMRLNSLEERLARLESEKKLQNRTQTPDTRPEAESDFFEVNLTLSAPFETKIGEYGLAWVGNIVLFFAIAFLWEYFNNTGKPVISLIVGLISAVTVFTLSHYFRKSYTHLSYTFSLFGFIILYYILLRLHYYSDKPLVGNQYVATFLLLALSGVQIFHAFRKHSQTMMGLALTLVLITAFVCYSKIPFFLITLTVTGIVLVTFWKFNWWKLLVFILIASFFVSLIWLLKNPVSLVKSPDDLTYHLSFICFSLVAALYSLVVFRKPDEAYPENFILAVILLAGIAYSVLLLLLVVLHFPTAYVPFYIVISIYSIIYSIILKFYAPWKFTPALYALYGFLAISIAVYGTYHFPYSYMLLIIQSFLVLTVALWYQSHIITLMNTFLLAILALFYYKSSGALHAVNFSIPVVAFLSARIINWQKERLNIKTDLIRNIYLIVLFFSLLYATYKALPGQYVTVSWLCTAGLYFVLSILLKNVKYRWMALAGLLVSALHLFLADLAKIDLIFRILAFLVFAVISIIISIYYVKKVKMKKAEGMV